MTKIQINLLFYDVVKYLKYLFVALLGVLFFIKLGLSLDWPIRRDSGFLHYIAYLINEHHYVPYRDIFEVNMPGTYIFHMAIGKLFGYSDSAFHLVDCIWLLLTLLVTWLIMQPFSKLVAFCSCFLFGLMYLKGGPHLSLQRDFIGLLPIATALLISIRRKTNHSINLVHFIQGIFFAFAALIKPHLVIGLPILIIYNAFHFSKKLKVKSFLHFCIKGSVFVVLGFLITVLGPFLWLWRIEAFIPFTEISSTYTPLYLQMTGDFQFVDSFSRIDYLLKTYLKFGGLGILVITALSGGYFMLTTTTISSTTKKITLLLFSLSFFYSLYALLGGKLWGYHWMPFTYYICLNTSLLLYTPSSFSQVRYRTILPLFLIVLISLFNRRHIIEFIYPIFNLEQPVDSMDDRVDEITTYLNEYVRSDDIIQPLDWISGGVHAMLRAEKIVATPYITDFQFYHDVSTPYIQKLRKDFLSSLLQTQPNILIDVYDKPKLSGLDVSYKFLELEKFIHEYYFKEYSGKGFDIYRKLED